MPFIKIERKQKFQRPLIVVVNKIKFLFYKRPNYKRPWIKDKADQGCFKSLTIRLVCRYCFCNLDTDTTKETLFFYYVFVLILEKHTLNVQNCSIVPNHCDVKKSSTKYHWYTTPLQAVRE